MRDSSASSSLRLSHRLFNFPSAFSRTTGSSRATASSTASGYTTVSGDVFISPDTTPSRAFIISSSVFFLRAVAPTTGTPSRFDIKGKSSRMFFRFASSIRLTQTTTLDEISIVCRTRLRLRSRQVASQTTTTASGPPKQIKFLATSSSVE